MLLRCRERLRRERQTRREAHLPTQYSEAGPYPRVSQAHVHSGGAGHLEVAAAQGAPPSQRLRSSSCLPGRSDASRAARRSPSCNVPGARRLWAGPGDLRACRGWCLWPVSPGRLRNWASLRRRGDTQPAAPAGPRSGAGRGDHTPPGRLPAPTRSRCGGARSGRVPLRRGACAPAGEPCGGDHVSTANAQLSTPAVRAELPPDLRGGGPRAAAQPAGASRGHPDHRLPGRGLGSDLPVPLLPQLLDLRRRGVHSPRVLAGAGAGGAAPRALPPLRSPRG